MRISIGRAPAEAKSLLIGMQMNPNWRQSSIERRNFAHDMQHQMRRNMEDDGRGLTHPDDTRFSMRRP